MVALGYYPMLWRVVGLLLCLLVSATFARPASYDATQLRLARATLQRRAGTRMMCLVHPRNCPPRHRRREDFVLNADPNVSMDTSFWQLWKLQMSHNNHNNNNNNNGLLRNADPAATYRL